MTNRNILDQNGFNSRNILNIRNQKLKDGKAIKINTSITNKNEIDVNFFTNTTEIFTFGDNELFLVSDATGENLQYLSGLRIKQGANNSLVAGNNINFTASGNHRQINIDSALTGITSINGYNANVLSVNNDNQQILVKDTNKNFTNGKFVSVDSSSKLTPMDILATDNITKTINSNDITLKLSNILTSIVYINGYGFNLTTNSVVNQFLLKDTTVGAFSSGDLLNVNSSGKIDNITPTSLFNNLTATLPIVKSTNNNNLSISSTPTFNIIESGGNGFTIQNTSGNALVKITSSLGGQPKLQYFQGTTLRVFQQYDSGNSKFDFAVKTGALHLKAYTDTTNTQLILDDEIIELKVGNSGNTATNILTCSFTEIHMLKPLYMNDNRLDLSVDSNADKYYIETNRTNPTFSTEIRGFNNVSFGTTNGGDNERMKIGRSRIDNYNPLYMNSTGASGGATDRPIYLHINTAFFIKYKFDNTSGSKINGVEIGGFGGSNGFDTACLRISATDPTYAGRLAEFMPSKINMYKPIDMNNQILNFKQNTDNPPNYSNYIKYTSDLMDGLELKGDGSTTNPFFKVKTSNNNVDLMNVYTNRVDVFKKLSVIKDNSSLQNDANDIFTVKNAGFCKAIIHSDNNDCELALKCGSSNLNQAVIKRFTNNKFLINNIGEFRVEVQNNTCNFQNNNGTLAWQSDRNLVIYDTGNNPIFSSGTNMPSERRLKDNIVSLNLENSYNIIKQLNPVSFVYKEDINTVRKGFIVDEIEDKIPECIKEINNCGECKDMTAKLLYKEDIVPDLVASVKYLINKVETLNQQLTTQSTLISNLQSKLNNI